MAFAKIGLAMVLAFALGIGSVAAEEPNKPKVDDSRPSPHRSKYPGSKRPVKYVVIHTAEGSYAGTLSWFTNPASKVSAHYTVAKDGRLGQSVQDDDIAWHAGNYNRQSIGIEHEGFARKGGWTESQYRKSAALVCWICREHNVPIDREHIVGHVEVPGATHTDPGPHWDWERFIGYVKECHTNCTGGGCK